MNGKELIIRALRNEPTLRPAWLPFVGVHGGYLIGESAERYLKSSDLIVQGLRKAYSLYKPDALPIVFDLQIEAEILGCTLLWSDEVAPAVISHSLNNRSIEELPALTEESGRIPIIVDAMDRIVKEIGDEVAFYGLICGPFTLALHLLGNDMFIKMYEDPEYVKSVVEYCAGIGMKMAGIYIEHGATVIAVVDPMISQISPEHFLEFFAPYANNLFENIRSSDAISSVFVCGDVTRNLEAMCNLAADNVSVDEQIPMEVLRELAQKNGKSFAGNIKLTTVLLLGNEDDAKRETLDIIEKSGNNGFILSPGCDIPYRVPEKNLIAVSTMVHDEYQRTVARASLQKQAVDEYNDVTLPDYTQKHAVFIDVVTLDSSSCAPCQYMMEAVKRAAEKYNGNLVINEHKIKERHGLGMMAKLGVHNLPTIVIDGEVCFASIIPDQKTLLSAIEAKAERKNAKRLKGAAKL
jgi:uroporphyrinogen decarboxylase